MNTKNVPGLSTTTRQSFPILKTSHAATVDSHTKDNRDTRRARREHRAVLASQIQFPDLSEKLSD
jgi:hypothetical protein